MQHPPTCCFCADKRCCQSFWDWAGAFGNNKHRIHLNCEIGRGIAPLQPTRPAARSVGEVEAGNVVRFELRSDANTKRFLLCFLPILSLSLLIIALIIRFTLSLARSLFTFTEASWYLQAALARFARQTESPGELPSGRRVCCALPPIFSSAAATADVC